MNLERLVRDHLDRDAATVDAGRMLAGVRTRLDAAICSSPNPRQNAVWRWRMAIAAVVILVGLFGVARYPAQAKPEQLLRGATYAHARPVDRCYRLRVEPAPELTDKFPALGRLREARIWTRGDRYVVEDGRTAWGRMADGRVWAAPSPRQGLIVDPAKLPPPLGREIERALRVRSLHLEALLRELPRDYTLTDLGMTPAGNRLLTAAPKPGVTHPLLTSAELEIDPTTRVVRHLTLDHQWRGRALARVSFTLEETCLQPDSLYELTGHLNAGAEVLSTERPTALLNAVAQILKGE